MGYFRLELLKILNKLVSICLYSGGDEDVETMDDDEFEDDDVADPADEVLNVPVSLASEHSEIVSSSSKFGFWHS